MALLSSVSLLLLENCYMLEGLRVTKKAASVASSCFPQMRKSNNRINQSIKNRTWSDFFYDGWNFRGRCNVIYITWGRIHFFYVGKFRKDFSDSRSFHIEWKCCPNFHTLKINTISCYVNHIYTLFFLCFFASVASIWTPMNTKIQNGDCPSTSPRRTKHCI